MLISELRQARRSVGLTQRALGGLIGADAQTIKRLEKGIGSAATLVQVMAALDFRLIGLAPGSTLAERLRNQRRKRGWSPEQVAARAGMSRTTVSNLEAAGGSVASLLRLMKVIAPSAKRRAPERAYWGEGDKTDRDSRFTPADFMANIYEAFGPIDLDPCANERSPVMARRRFLLSEGDDGLADPWSGRLAYVNPPFSALLVWLRRAYEQWRAGNVDTVVCLVPVRTDSAWFHEELSPVADIYLLRGRVRFLDSNGKGQHTPFSLMLVTLGATETQKLRYAQLVNGYWLARRTDHGNRVR